MDHENYLKSNENKTVDIPLHLTKYAIAHESLCPKNQVNFSAQFFALLMSFETFLYQLKYSIHSHNTFVKGI